MIIGNGATQPLPSVPALTDFNTDRYWHELLGELRSLAVDLGHSDILVLMTEDSDPRWEDADCLLVYGLIGSNQSEQAYFKLCYLRNDRSIIFHRAPLDQHFGEQEFELSLSRLPTGKMVARSSDRYLSPRELAAFFMDSLSSRLKS